MYRLIRIVSALAVTVALPCLALAETVTVKAATLGVNFCLAKHNMSADSSELYGFYDGERGGLLEEKAWVNVNAASGSIDLTDSVNGASYHLQWQAGGDVWSPGDAAGQLLASYLDNGSTLTLSGLPPSGYDVAIIFSGDGGQFSAVTVNGTDKTYDADGQLVNGSSVWGDRTALSANTKTLSATGTATTGNVMYLAGLTSPMLTLQTYNNATDHSGRGTIAAIQIYPKPGTCFDLTERGADTIAFSELEIAEGTQEVVVTLAAGATLKVDEEVELTRLRLRSEGIVGISGAEGTETLEAVLSGIAEFDYTETAGLDIGTLSAGSLTIRNGKTLAMAAVNQVTTLTREAGSTLKLTGDITGDRDALPLQDNTTLETTGDVSLGEIAINETLNGRSWTLSGGDSHVGQLFLRSGDAWTNPGASGTFTLRNGATLTVESNQLGISNSAGGNAAMLCVTSGTQTTLIEGTGTHFSAPNGAVSLSRDGKAVVTVREGATFSAYRLGCVAQSGGSGSTMTVENATLALGKEGATDGLLKFTNGTLALKDGTVLTANGDWGVDAATAASALTATGTVTVRPEGHTITLRKFSGEGAFAVEGPGSVVFAEGMASTGGLSVEGNATVHLGTWRPTLTALAQGVTLLLTAASDELLDIRLPLAPGISIDGVTISVEGWDEVELRSDGGTLVLTKPSTVATWMPTDANAAWNDLSLWKNTESVPTAADQVTLDYRALTQPKTVAIPTGTTFGSVVLQGSDAPECALTFTLGADVTLGALTIAGNVTVPLAAVNANEEGISIGEQRTLTVDVGPEDGALAVAISGEGAFAKIGTGTLTLNADVTAMGGTTVAEGTLRFGTATIGGKAYSSAGNVTVAAGATLDAAGVSDAYLNTVTLREGATYANSGADIGTGKLQLKNLALEGDASIVSEGACGLIAKGYAATALTLNGHTLTKRGAGAFWLTNTTVSSGTLRVEAGKFQVVNNPVAFIGPMTFDAGTDTAFDLSGQTVTLSGALTKRGTGAMTFPGVISGNGALIVEAGTLTLTAANTRGNANIGSVDTTIEKDGTLVLSGDGRLYGTDYATGTVTIRGHLFTTDWVYGKAFGALGHNTGYTVIDGGTVTFTENCGNASETATRGFTITANGASLETGKGVTYHKTNNDAASITNNGTLRLTGAGVFNFAQSFGGAVTVAGGATLSGTGTLSGTVTFEEGAVLDASAEVLTVGGLALPASNDSVTVKVASGAAKGSEVLKLTTAAPQLATDVLKVEGATLGVAPNAEGTALILTFAAELPETAGTDGGELTEGAAKALLLAAERLNVTKVSSLTGRSGNRDLTAAELSGALECFQGDSLVTAGAESAEGTPLVVAYEFGIADAVYDRESDTLTVTAQVRGGTFAPDVSMELYFTDDDTVAATATPEADTDKVTLQLKMDISGTPRPFKVRVVRH